MRRAIRKDEILDILRRYNYVTVEYLSNVLYISQASVRRDLAVMEAQGLVRRSHGGVHSIEDNNILTPHSIRMHENSVAKRIICQKAIDLVSDGDFIFIDGSTTCLYLPELLQAKKNLTILTNSIKLASMFDDKNNITVYCTGGQIRLNENVSFGSIAEYSCKFMHTNLMFFSARAIDENGIISDFNEPETAIRRIAIQNTERAVFLCDSTKFNKHSAFTVCHAQDVSHIVTDIFPDEETVERWRAKKII